jgi:hypothetical protein
MDTNLLINLTNQLIEYNKQTQLQFTNRTTDLNYEVDFFGEVKPFADQVQQVADEWIDIAREWVIINKPKYVFPMQLNDTHENMTIAAVLAFQLETRDNAFKHKRFLEMVKSIEYVLEALQKSLQNKPE